MEEDKILQELQTPETKKSWYKTFWGISIIIVLLVILGMVSLFANKVQYYQKAFQTQDKEALQGYFIDASNYSKTGNQVSRTEVETADSPYWGDENAKVVIVEFGDFQCPFCKKNVPALKRLRREYSDRVKLIYRNLPVSYVHPQAVIAAQASLCANDQKMFWPYHDLLFEKQDLYETVDELIGFADDLGLNTELFSTCMKTEKYKDKVNFDLQEAMRFGAQGTPTFFINGILISGVIEYDTLKTLVDRFLEKLQ